LLIKLVPIKTWMAYNEKFPWVCERHVELDDRGARSRQGAGA